MKFIKLIFLVLIALAAVPTFAQDKPADSNMQILMDKVKADNTRNTKGENSYVFHRRFITS